MTEENTGASETYTGLTARRFKDRLYEHTTDMNNQHNKGTTLSGHVWDLKGRKRSTVYLGK